MYAGAVPTVLCGLFPSVPMIILPGGISLPISQRVKYDPESLHNNPGQYHW